MLDKQKVGHHFPTYHVNVESGFIRFFAQAIGESSPVYTNLAAAKEAGYPDIVAPPTFLFRLDMSGHILEAVIDLFDLDIGKLLHGSQEFEYSGLIFAGDTITVQSRIVGADSKKQGKLEFITSETRYINQKGKQVATARQVLIHKNG